MNILLIILGCLLLAMFGCLFMIGFFIIPLRRKNGLVTYNGNKEWYQYGKLHRIGGPAVEHANGDKLWYQQGKLHRYDGPAVEYSNGNKEWYQNDKLHRVTGPAIEKIDGHKEWWYCGKQIDCSSQEEFETYLRIECISQKEFKKYIKRNAPDGLLDFEGHKLWIKDKKLHRVNGPAVELDNGDKEWWYQGKKIGSYTSFRQLGSSIEKWWYQGEYIKCSSQKEFEKYLKLKAFW